MTSGQPTELKNAGQLLEIAVDAAEAAATIIREHAREARSIPWQVKSHSDFVTIVDTAAEHAIRDVVLPRAPGARVLGEELSPDVIAHDGVTFVVDPLDGTTNFLHGFPAYAVSIAAAIDGVVEAGVVLDVPNGDRYTAIRGQGARKNGEQIRVSAIDDPTKSLIGTGFPFKHLVHLEKYQRQFAAIVRTTSGIRRPGAAALDLASVATGAFDGFWELMLAPWDVAAGILLVREAGGVVTDVDGNEISGLQHGPLLAASRALHKWLLSTLQSA